MTASRDEHDFALDAGRLLAIVRTQNDIAASALAVDGVMGVVAASAMDITGADAGVVELVEGDEMVYRAVCGTAARHAGLRLRIDSSLSGLSVREGDVMICDDAGSDPRVNHEAARAVGAISMLCVPLQHADATPGVLKVYADRPNAFGPADVATLRLLSGVIGAHLTHAAEYERRAHESRHDSLTDLSNRRAYDERLVKEVARSMRYGRPLSLVLFDLDGFKAVNDSAGHPAGDEVLRRVAAILRSTRVADECFRLGGDEFALLLPDTTVGGAELVAARVAQRVREARLGVEGELTVTCGVAGCEGPEAMALHAAADERLMAAKREPGRASR